MDFEMVQKNIYNNKLLIISVGVLVFAITLAVFSEVLKADFVMWDDDILILGNQKLTGNSFWWAFTDVDSMQRYNPLTFLAWYATYHLTGFDPCWFHFGNWLLHGLSALLLYLAVRDMLIIAAGKNLLDGLTPFSRELAAVSGALLWALHPLRVEPVAWATDRTYCQAMFFLLGSLLCYLKAHQTLESQKYRLFLGSSLVCYVCSLLSYPLGITFFMVFFLIDIFLLRPDVFSCSSMKWSIIKQMLLEKLYFVLPAFAFGIVAVIVKYRSSAIWESPAPLTQFGIIDRVMQSFYIWSYYLWKSFYPGKLAPVYTALLSFDPFSPPFELAVVLIGGISAFCILFRKRWPFLLGIWLCYLVLQVPFLGIFEHPHFPVDRYSLLSSLSFSVLAAVLLVRITGVLRHWQAVTGISVVLVMFAVLTFKQVKVWNNSETLFIHTIQTLGDDPYRTQIVGRLATYYYQIGQTEKSIETFKKLLAIKPTSYRAHSQLAAIYGNTGRYADALPHLIIILKQDPDNPKVNYDFATALQKLGRHEEADQHFRRAEMLQGRVVKGQVWNNPAKAFEAR